jgi:hypothetical protein
LQEAIDQMEAASVGGVVALEGTTSVGRLTEREVLEARGRPVCWPIHTSSTHRG